MDQKHSDSANLVAKGKQTINIGCVIRWAKLGFLLLISVFARVYRVISKLHLKGEFRVMTELSRSGGCEEEGKEERERKKEKGRGRERWEGELQQISTRLQEKVDNHTIS